MFDLHTHILPALDDGAHDMEETLAMLKLAAKSGTTDLVATPHVIEGVWLPSWEEIVAKTKQVAELARQHNLTITIYPGAEVAMGMDILDKLRSPGPYCLNGSKYLLVELPSREIPAYADEFFFTLQARGIMPVLAHPERHPLLCSQPELLYDWLDKGLLLQVNAGSLTGQMGKKVMANAEMLLNCNMIHVLGSDAHSLASRRPLLESAAKKMTVLAGAEQVQQITLDYPKKILANQDIAVDEYHSFKIRRQGGFCRWLKKMLT